MAPRLAASLLTVRYVPGITTLALTLGLSLPALAAPSEDGPPIQRPSKPADGTAEAPVDAEAATQPPGETGETTGETPDVIETESGPEEGAPAEGSPTAEAPSEVAPADTPADGEEKPAMEDLLVSNEEAPSRVRVAPDPNRSNVDHNERMRNYYKDIYRPAHNPSRVYFAARAAFALAGTSDTGGGGRMGMGNIEVGQTWNYIGWAIGPTLMAGSLTFGEQGIEQFGGILVGGGPSIGLGRLSLLGRGYLDLRLGYNFFYAPIASTRAELSDPPDASPHGPKVQVDVGLLLHDSESRRFRHGLGANIGYQALVHSFTGDGYPRINAFTIGLGYFFG